MTEKEKIQDQIHDAIFASDIDLDEISVEDDDKVSIKLEDGRRVVMVIHIYEKGAFPEVLA